MPLTHRGSNNISYSEQSMKSKLKTYC